MSAEHFLDRVPVWAFFVLISLIALGPIEIGQRLGERRRRKSDHEPEGPVGSVVGATLALLGFMVALTLGAATARFDSRREALTAAATAIETAFRTAPLCLNRHNSESGSWPGSAVAIRRNLPALKDEPG